MTFSHISRHEALQLLSQKKGKGNKFGAKKTVVDGETLDSKAEARHYAALKLRMKLGEIYALARQPEFPLIVEGKFIGKYTADFAYFDRIEGRFRVIDVKGVETRDSRRTQKHIEALYQIKVEIVK